MREFFRGWRRKVGCITLMMATAVFGLWMRSTFIGDHLQLSISESCLEELMSGDQCLVWSRDRNHSFDENEARLHYNMFIANEWLDSPNYCEWEWRYGQFRYGGNQRDRMTCVVFPHWSVVLPLTLISIYLILWKPRQVLSLKQYLARFAAGAFLLVLAIDSIYAIAFLLVYQKQAPPSAALKVDRMIAEFEANHQRTISDAQPTNGLYTNPFPAELLRQMNAQLMYTQSNRIGAQNTSHGSEAQHRTVPNAENTPEP